MPNQSPVKILYTAGYEKLEVGDFIKKLKDHGVQYLIDIREKPLSRKKGFSKTALKNHLIEENIYYLHYRELGSPTEIRKKLREDGDYNLFFQEFTKHLSTQQDALNNAVKVIQNFICCLLCYERNHEQCHRKVVAKELLINKNNSIEVKHL